MKIQIARFLAAIFMAISTLLTASNCPAATWYVGTNGNDSSAGSKSAPFATIQYAINRANNGDNIIVLPGNYSGVGNYSLNFYGKQIALQSQSGPDKTCVDLNKNYAILANSGETTNTIVDGFQFTNGFNSSGDDWHGCGIVTVLDNPLISSLTVKNCIFSQNTVRSTYLTTYSSVIYAVAWGVDSTNHVSHVENCLFYSNNCVGGKWNNTIFASVIALAPLDWPFSNGDVFNCTIANNNMSSTFGDINSNTAIPAVVARNILNTITWGNSSTNKSIYAMSNSISYPNPTYVGPSSCTYSIAQYGSVGSSSFVKTNNPLFVNPAIGNFSLKANSPAKKAGDPNSSLNVDGTRADMGYRSDLANIRSSMAPILVYSLKGSQFTALPSSKTTFPWTGYALSDDKAQSTFVITYAQGGTNFFSIYSSTNTDVQSTGYWIGSYKLYSAALAEGVFPNVEKEVVWITGTNAVVPLSASKSIIAPKTMSALDNVLTLQGGTMIVNQSGTLTIDTNNTLTAITNNESIDQTITRLSNSLNQQGYRYQQQ
jgi:hypothetical protein